MKKSLLALAVLGAFAGASQAQTSVTLYGKVDLGIVAESGGAAGSVTKLTSGVSGGSRLGFRGVEDLGGGLKARFQLETGFCADSNAGAPNFCTGGNNFMGRQAWVGLDGGFGSVQLGRQYTPAFINLTTIDPFGTGLAGQTTNLFDAAGNSAANPRFNNAVIYTTPNLSGFSGSLAYGFGEVTGNASASRAIGFSASYSSGPVYVGLGYHNVNSAAGVSVRKNTNFGGTYDFGAAKAHFLYQTTKNAPYQAAVAAVAATTVQVTPVGGGNPVTITLVPAKAAIAADKTSYNNTADWMLGVSAPLGSGTLLASYINHNDKKPTNLDAAQFGIAYLYGLSKRTSLYTAFAKISNKNGAFYTVGNATDGGTGNRAFNLGVVHNF
jgi:predicted porin